MTKLPAVTRAMVGSAVRKKRNPAREVNLDHVLTGARVRALMRKHGKTIPALAREMGITQVRVKQVREKGVSGINYVRDWLEAITGSTDLSPARVAMARGPVKKNPTHSGATVKAARLYSEFTGHQPEVIGSVDFKLPKSAVRIGECDAIQYTTVRAGRVERYEHKFRAKDRPLLCVSPDGKQALLVGGNYEFTERGFIDDSDLKNRR